MLYLYGLLDPESDPGALTEMEGVGGRVSVAPCGKLCLIHGWSEEEEILPRRRDLLAHARVLEAAMAFGTVLPMRFGMVSPSAADIHERIACRADQVDQALDHLRGRVELGIRITAPEEAALSATLAREPSLRQARQRLATGADHFQKIEFGRKLGEAMARHRAEGQKQALAQLAPMVVDHVLRAPESDAEVLRAEVLVDRAHIEDFSTGLEGLCADLTFAGPTPCDGRIIGPGPAFSFVKLVLDGAPSTRAA